MAISVDQSSLYTVEELAGLFGIQERTLRAYIKEGRLRGRKLARRWYVSGRSIMTYFEEGHQTGIDEDKEDEEDQELTMRLKGVPPGAPPGV